jgi:protein-S-isoprenylcysteine O-methyltransferase Ste14
LTVEGALASAAPAGWFTRDRLARIGAVSGFFAVDVFLIARFAATARTTAWDDTLGLAHLMANACVIMFVAMMAALTILRDQPQMQAPGARPRIAAVIGTNLLLFGAFFLPPRGPLSMFEAVASTVLILTGNLLSVVVVRRLGRSFSIMAEARALVTDGPYALIRHPLYLVEEVAVAGVFIQFATWPAAALFAVHFGFQLQRMRNEERVLMRAFPREYRAYAARTARLIPGIW